MATIQKRTSKTGDISYRVQIRMRGMNLSETFSRKTDAKTWATQTEAAIREQRLTGTAARKHTVTQLVDRFVTNELDGLKSASDNKRHLIWWKNQIGGYLLSDVTPELLREYRDKLKREKTPSTANRYHVSLSAAMNVAMNEWGWITQNPFSRIKKLKEPRGRVRFLSDAERVELLEACKESRSPYLYTVVVLALSTGMRLGEIMGLTWPDIDLKVGRITLTDTKNGETRAVPVVGTALDILRNHAKVRRIDTQLVFPTKRGDKPASIRDAWVHALERTDIEDFHFHDLRHTAASYLAMNGASLAEIAEVLGHKTLAMVKRYSHFTTDHVSGVISKLDQRMFGGE